MCSVTKTSQNIAVIGAGINGLVAANYLVRAGHQVTLLERVGGACVSETVEVQGIRQEYPLGATTLGLMQDFVWWETGLADRLQGRAGSHPDLVFFPGIEQPTRIYRDASEAAREFADRWGEQGDLAAYAPIKIGWCAFCKLAIEPVSRPALRKRLQSWGQTWPRCGSPGAPGRYWIIT